MNAVRRTARWVHGALQRRRTASKSEQADVAFLTACVRLEMHRRLLDGSDASEVNAAVAGITDKYAAMPLPRKIQHANDMVTDQVAVMLGALRSIDSGDIPLHVTAAAPAPPLLGDTTGGTPEQDRALTDGVDDGSQTVAEDEVAEASAVAAHEALARVETRGSEIEVSSATSAGKLELAQQERAVAADLRHVLTATVGHSLWIGPSQAQTPEDKVGVYAKGYVPPGAVVGFYLGRVYNQEMLLKASDAGHLNNPEGSRRFVLRFDDTLIDTCDKLPGVHNPFALAQYVRHPPQGIAPNVMRLQFDVVEEGSPLNLKPLPPSLQAYIPNRWGAAKTLANSFVNMTEQGIFMKCCVLIATRELLDEELFVDHQLNPWGPQPEWYTPLDVEADKRLWSSITNRS